MNIRMTFTLTWRYAFSTGNRHRKANVGILAGIAAGMMALITILSLMNSLQWDLLHHVRSIESFHAQVSMPVDTIQTLDLGEITDRIKAVNGVSTAYPFIDLQALIQDTSSRRSTTMRIRAIPSSFWESDNQFTELSHIALGDIQRDNQLMFGSTIGTKLAVRIGDSIRITFLRPGRTATLAPFIAEATAGGMFSTKLAEFDASTLFADFDWLFEMTGTKTVTFGVFVEDQYVANPHKVTDALSEVFPEAEVRSWQQVNDAFYSALLLEKTLMYLFLFSMFIIMGVNIRNSSARLLFHKRREAAMLRALGIKKSGICVIFLLQGTLIALLGILLGVCLGLLLTDNIQTIFSWFNSLQKFFSGKSNSLLAYPFTIIVKPAEIILASALIILLALMNSFIGIRRMLAIEPMEMLYHE